MIVVQTPIRISFVGGGTDFREYWSSNGGGVISSAIDKYVYVIVKRRFDDDIYINYSNKEIVQLVDDIKHDLVREAMRKTGVDKGVEITTLADIPSEGSGLGSSSSITVALLHALYTYQGELVTAEKLAKEACEIEIDILGSPIGIQDQYIAAYGGLRHFEFRPDGTVGAELLLLNETERRQFGSNLHLFFLNRTRKAGDILKEQRAKIGEKRKVLDSMRDMVQPFKEAILKRDFDSCGRFLHEDWSEKKKLVDRITNPEIERYYEVARETGALGGKVSGAGAGGFLLLYCQRWKQNRVFEKMHEMGLKELPFNLERYGSRVIFTQNGYAWR
jgi:D-glycero-alpha-D-manno-heptose-7-phosphate kinase